MSATTKHKLEFAVAMARHTRATVRQIEALMRYAATLHNLDELQCNVPWTDALKRKRERIETRVKDLCKEIPGFCKAEKDVPVCRVCEIEWLPDHVCNADDIEANFQPCTPVFSHEPMVAALVIRVPDGFTNNFDKTGIRVPQ